LRRKYKVVARFIRMLTRDDSNSSEDVARFGPSIVIGKRQLRSGKVDVLYNAEQRQAQAITSPLPDSGEDDDIYHSKRTQARIAH